MFESFEVRKVANGFILVLTTEDGNTKEFVYDTSRKLMRVLRQYLDAKGLDE
jgi:hypothetical protein